MKNGYELTAKLVTPAEVGAVGCGNGSHLLGLVVHGTDVELAANLSVPMARTPLQPLGLPLVEVFESSSPTSVERLEDIELAHDGIVLFGRLEPGEESEDLGRLAYEGFRVILESIGRYGYEHLLRVWVTLPGINQDEGGRERYQAFCRGRSVAFEERYGPAFTRRLCASTAVGSSGGRLAIHFLAARHPGEHCENPRQVSAYLYPRQYGPRSPSFARATVAPHCLGDLSFIAGTASIVGHASCHPGDVGAQLRETFANLRCLQESLPAVPGNGSAGTPVTGLLKVYIRNSEDIGEVRRGLEDLVEPGTPTLFLRADICRRELLLEIEAVRSGRVAAS